MDETLGLSQPVKDVYALSHPTEIRIPSWHALARPHHFYTYAEQLWLLLAEGLAQERNLSQHSIYAC